MPGPDDENCGECYFFKRNYIQGHCVRYPSGWTGTDEYIQPPVKPDDWCGEFKYLPTILEKIKAEAE